MGCTKSTGCNGDINVPMSSTNLTLLGASDMGGGKAAVPIGAKVGLLAQVPLFRRLSKDDLEHLAATCAFVDFKQGETIAKADEIATSCFVIRSGRVFVTQRSGGRRGSFLTMGSGDYIGENAMLRQEEPWAIDISAETTSSILKVDRLSFRNLNLHNKLARPKAKVATLVSHHANLAKLPSPKTDQDKETISRALLANQALCTIIDMDDYKVNQLTEIAWKEFFPAGTDVITQGDLNAHYFYILQRGGLDVMISERLGLKDGVAAFSEPKFIRNLAEESSFGELALLHAAPRSATVRAYIDTDLWVIDRSSFKHVMMDSSTQKCNEYLTYLSRVEALKDLPDNDKTAMAQALIERRFAKGEAITEEGDQASAFYIIYDGEVVITRNGKEEGRLQASKVDGITYSFGERELQDQTSHPKTVTVESEIAEVLALDRDSFNMLMGLADAGPKPASAEVVGNYGTLPLSDLTIIGLLGYGRMGTVELCEHTASGTRYALKSMSKGFIVREGCQERILIEKHILESVNSPFIIKMREAYNTPQSLKLLLEIMDAGDLYGLYTNNGLYGDVSRARFYTASVLLAFEHLHGLMIIYRDLKPENVLLDRHGYAKLADFDLSKVFTGKTYSRVGTPEYFAPEMVTGEGHGYAVDWWTLGIFLYDLMAGEPPFNGDGQMVLYANIMAGINKVAFPTMCRGTIADVIKALLKHDSKDRLPMRKGGLDKLKKMKWFKELDWKAMASQQLEAPFRPVERGREDLLNVEEEKEHMPQQYDYIDDGSGWDKDYATVA